MKNRKILMLLLLIVIILLGLSACVNDRYKVDVVCDGQQGIAKGSGKYKPGETLEISALAKDGYVFDKWSDDNPNPKRNITVEADITYTATFKKLYKIEVQCDTKKGTVTGGGEYTEGTQIQISVQPKGDNALYQWNDGEDELSRTITITKDFVYIAEFVDITNFLFEKETGRITGYVGDPEKIIIPKYIYDIKVNEIGDYAFYEKNSLSYIRIPDSVTRIGARALSVTSLITVEIPSSVTVLGNSALSDNPKLVSVAIPDSVTEMGTYMFFNCKALKSVTLSSSITTLGRETFSKCPSLTEVILPGSIKAIDEYAFNECTSLVKVILPEGLESLNYTVFAYCTALKSITIPASVKDMKSNSLQGSSLTSIYVVKGSYADIWCLKNNFSSIVVYVTTQP